MIEAGGIAGISISFTAGIAAASVCGEADWAPFLMPLCAVALLFTAGCGDSRHFACPVLFFILGAFCRCNGFLCGSFPPQPFPSRFRDGLCSLIDSIPFGREGTAALVKALLVGVKDGLSPETTAEFRKSGAAHLLALSGLHLGIIYSILHYAMSVAGNGRRTSVFKAVAVIALCGFYTLVTGAGPSIVRAFLFISLNEVAGLHRERKRSPASVMFTALIIQLNCNPAAIGSPGFQLSYLAVCGIVFVYPRLETLFPESGDRILDRINPFRKIWRMMALSLSCQLFTGALVLYRFGTFPVYFLLTNLTTLPLCEAMIVSAVFCTATTAMGICPEWGPAVTDTLASLMESTLEIISTM